MNLKHSSSATSETPTLPIVPDDGEMTSPAEIDARRAHGLLDRAQHLAERGDLPAALLACRQAIALTHDSPEGYSMLGGLLERTHDLPGALQAYEKALELAPTNALDLESLKRLRLKMAAATEAAQVHFGEDELFATDTLPSISEAPAPVPATAPAPIFVPTAAQVEAEVAALPAVALENTDARLPPTREQLETRAETPVVTPTVPVALPEARTQGDATAAPASTTPAPLPAWANPTPAAPAPAPYIATSKGTSIFGAPAVQSADLRRNERRQLHIPVEFERRSGFDRRLGGLRGASFVFSHLDDPKGAPLWAQMLRGPSFFGRTLPLVAITVFSLAFLGWARAKAVAQLPPPPVVVESELSDPNATKPVVETTTQNPAPALIPPPPSGTGEFSISTVPQPTVASNPPPVAAPARGATSSGTRSASNPRPRTGRGAPNVLPPAAIVPGAVRRGNGSSLSNSGTTGLGLPAPQINTSQSPPPIQVLPPSPDSSFPAVGSNPLRPGGAPRGTIRIQEGRLSGSTAAGLPPRPANQANNEEEQANTAAGNGQTNAAIGRLNNAINSDPNDLGFRLQQRATLFLDRGDYVRAADDYQSAITAYQDQIDRGENVASARAGLRAARSGLSLALAGQR